MAKKPSERGKSASGKSGKLGVKSETFKKFTNKQLDSVKGGLLTGGILKRGLPIGVKPSMDPTDTSGCCG
jgi:hypothetical protein